MQDEVNRKLANVLILVIEVRRKFQKNFLKKQQLGNDAWSKCNFAPGLSCRCSGF